MSDAGACSYPQWAFQSKGNKESQASKFAFARAVGFNLLAEVPFRGSTALMHVLFEIAHPLAGVVTILRMVIATLDESGIITDGNILVLVVDI